MLDSYQIGRGGPSVINVDVAEKRAPTDESVRLLKEMERAAEAKVLEAVRCGDNTFACTIHYQDDRFSDQRVFAAIFKLNGRKLRADYRASADAERDDVIAGIITAISTEIARNIVGAFAELSRREAIFTPPLSRRTS